MLFARIFLCLLISLFSMGAFAQKKILAKVGLHSTGLRGTIAYVDPTRPYYINLYYLSTNATATVFVGFPIITSVALDPISRNLAFTAKSNAFAQSEIYRIGLDGSNLVNISNTPEMSEAGVSYSPNGLTIAYHAKVGDGAVEPVLLFHMNSDGSKVVKLFEETVLYFTSNPRFSKDGQHLYFSGATNQISFQIYSYELKTKSLEMIPRTASASSTPENPQVLGDELIYTVYSSDPNTYELKRDFRKIILSKESDELFYQTTAFGLGVPYRGELIESPYTRDELRYEAYLLVASGPTMALLNSSGNVLLTLPVNATYFSYLPRE